MIGGSDKYMPLCRDCHERESKLNSDNLFVGDPQLIDVNLENENEKGQSQSPETTAS